MKSSKTMAKIATIRFLQYFSVGLIAPVFTMMFLERGLTLSQVSLCVACYSATIILLELPTGIFADLMGRKNTFLLSVAFAVMAFIIILFGITFALLCIGNIVYGISRALASGSLDALFIEQYTKEEGADKLVRIISAFTATEATGLALGSLCGGCLPMLTGTYTGQIRRYDLNLIVKLICLLALGALVLALVHEQRPQQQKTVLIVHLKGSLDCVKGSRNLKFIMLSLVATGVMLSAVESGWQPRFLLILQNDALLWLLGVLAMLYFGAILLGSLACEKAILRFGIEYKRMFIASKLLGGVSLFVLAFQTRVAPFVLAYSLVYFFVGAKGIPEGTLTNLEIPDDKRASILSLNSLVFQLGALLGSLIGSVVLRYFGIPTLWRIAAGVVLLSSVAVAQIRERGKGEPTGLVSKTLD
jgi:MFS family permease